MPMIESVLDPRSPEARANAETMRGLVADLWETAERVRLGGGQAARERHLSRGKLLPRDRIRAAARPRLAVPGGRRSSPRTACMAARCPAAGIITGIGRVSGRECMIVANDATVKGGTYFPMTVKKHLRAQEIALQNRLPCIYLVDSRRRQPAATRTRCSPTAIISAASSTTRRNMSAAGIAADRRGDGLLHRRRRLRAGDVATRAIIVRNQGTIFLAGPPLVKAATGEVVTRRGAGRRRRAQPHLRASPITMPRTTPMRWASRAASSASLNRVKRAGARRCASRAPPRYDAGGDLRHRPGRPAQALRRARGHRAHRRRQRSSTSSSSSTARRSSPASRTSGAIRSASSPTTASCSRESALKGAHFIELCAQRGIPLVFLQNITGFMVGRKYEAGGIAKDGAKMVTAVATRRRCRSSPSSSAAASAPAITACAAAPTRRASCGCGPTRASR